MTETNEKMYAVSKENEQLIEESKSRLFYIFFIISVLYLAPSIRIFGGLWLFMLIPFAIYFLIAYFCWFILKKAIWGKWLKRKLKITNEEIILLIGNISRPIKFNDIKRVVFKYDERGVLQRIYIWDNRGGFFINLFENMDEIAQTIKQNVPASVIKEQKSFLYNPRQYWKMVLFIITVFCIAYVCLSSADEVLDWQIIRWGTIVLDVYLGWFFIFSKMARGFYVGRGWRIMQILFGLYFLGSGVWTLSKPIEKKDEHFVCPLTLKNGEDINYFKNQVMAASQIPVDSAEITHFGYVDGRTNREFCFLGHGEKSSLIHATETIPAGLGNSFGIKYVLKSTSKKYSYVPLLAQYVHPPITSPLTGEVVTTEELPSYAYVGEEQSMGWNLDYERELVPGDWTFRVIYKDRVLAEKTFHVIAVDNIYKTASGRAKEIPLFKEKIAQNPNDAELVKNFGHLYLDIGDTDQAIVEYKKAIAINPHPNYYNNVCLAYNEKKKYDLAMEACNTALSLNPEHTSAFINRGNTYRLREEYDKAVDDYTQSLKVVPANDLYNPPIAYYNRALAYEKMEEYDKAFDDARLASAIQPHNREYKYLAGKLKRKASFGKRFDVLKANPIFLSLGAVSLLLGLFLMFFPQRIIKIQRDYYQQKSWTMPTVALDQEIRKTSKAGWMLFIIVLFIIMYQMGYIY